MKILFLFLLSILLFAANCFATIRIEEVGLQGYYSTASPTPVRIRISDVPQAGPVHLEVKIVDGGKAEYGPLRTDRYSLIVNVNANQDSEVDVPIDLNGNNGSSELEVTATDSSGQSVGSASLDLNSSAPTKTNQDVVLIHHNRGGGSGGIVLVISFSSQRSRYCRQLCHHHYSHSGDLHNIHDFNVYS